MQRLNRSLQLSALPRLSGRFAWRSPTAGACLLLGLVASLWLAPQVQAASNSSSVDLQLFLPMPSGKDFVTVSSGEVAPHLALSTGLSLDWGHDLLQVEAISNVNTQAVVGSVVANRVQANLMASLGLYNWGEIGLVLPLVYQNGFEQQSFTNAGINLNATHVKNFTLGDVRIVPKVQLFNIESGLLALAVLPEFTLPSAAQAAYIGEKSLTFVPRLALSTRLAALNLGLNLGYRFRKAALLSTVTIGNEIVFKGAAALNLNYRGSIPVEIIGELFGYTPDTHAFNLGTQGIISTYEKAVTPLEGDVGMRIRLPRWVLSFGGGGGLLPGYGAPVPRLYVELQHYSGQTVLRDRDGDGIPDRYDLCPDRPEDKDGFEDEDGCPDLDNDRDGIPDEDDQCPNEAEDKDGFQDEDGCPDLDNDHDGILDEKDQCPNDPEDRDGFQDEDGCPDPDNDGDHIIDTLDKCPNEAEDFDGFQDEDGCPDLDNDNDGLPDLNDLCPNFPEDYDGFKDEDGCPDDNDADGIADEKDKCPNEPETYNGYRDDDGCPDSVGTRQLVRVTDEKIEIKEKVLFRSGSSVIDSRSYALLNQVAAVLSNFKHISKLRIEGHTDNQGARQKNIKLSSERATAVRTYLVEHGVAASRLSIKGFGPDKPLVPNIKPANRERNRRVEFVIVTQQPIGPEVQPQKIDVPNIQVELPANPEAAPNGASGAPSAPPPPPPPSGGAPPLLDLQAPAKPSAPPPPSKTANPQFNF